MHFVKKYQSFVNLLKDDSKTVECVNKHRKEPFPAELQFAFVRMSCVHYGLHLQGLRHKLCAIDACK